MIAVINSLVATATAAFNAGLPSVNAYQGREEAELAVNQRQLDAEVQALEKAKCGLKDISSRLAHIESVARSFHDATRRAEERREAVLPRLAHQIDFIKLLGKQCGLLTWRLRSSSRRCQRRESWTRAGSGSWTSVNAQKRKVEDAERAVTEQESLLAELSIRLEATRYWSALIRAGPRLVAFDEPELEVVTHGNGDDEAGSRGPETEREGYDIDEV